MCTSFQTLVALSLLLAATTVSGSRHSENLLLGDGILEESVRLKRQVIEGPTTHIYEVGATGDKGQNGARGSTGALGDDGAKGFRGATGNLGFKGIKGVKGELGTDGGNVVGTGGARGARGSRGEPGAVGSTGFLGIDGSDGATGATGNPGARGVEGAQGVRGTEGLKGAVGSRGMKGAAGAAGDPGDKGTQGSQGLTGSKGPRGPEGDTLQSVKDNRMTTCSSAGVQCTQGQCEDTLVGPLCICNSGYELVPGNNMACQDRDQCAMGMCQQSCVNSGSSYSCACLPGYIINSDGVTCSKVSPDCDCGSDEYCGRGLTAGLGCLPNALSVTTGGQDSVRAAAQANKEVPVETTSWVNDNWVIIFIVWGMVLTVLAIAVGIWLGYERGNPNITHYNSMNGTVSAPHSIILQSAPSTIDRRYNSTLSRDPHQVVDAPQFAQLQYPHISYIGNNYGGGSYRGGGGAVLYQ